MRPTDFTIAEGLRALDKRQISSVELTQAYVKAIEALNPRLNAYITVAGEGAVDAALKVVGI